MFIGRKEELAQLKEKINQKSASFIVIRGRRRIGKSRLIAEFAKEFSHSYFFTGLPPHTNSTAHTQREEFIRQMKKQSLPIPSSEDWGDIFWVLGNIHKKGSVLIALDEISWMGSKDPEFLGKLKIAWDQYFETNPQLILVIASSVSSWIDKNILKNTGFFGRIDLRLTLKELPLCDCIKFWGKRQNAISSFEKLKLLSVTGGVPKYLGAIDPKVSAEANIERLCFTESGLLFNEFESIFHDLFSKRSSLYQKIVRLLSEKHSLTQKQICDNIGRSRGRPISEYLNDLVTAGFLTSDYTWNLKSYTISRLRKYRLSDNYLRFYLKCIEPKKMVIQQSMHQDHTFVTNTNWESIMGLQFENLVSHNNHLLLQALSIEPSKCIAHGPFFQNATTRQRGCQIDYLIQTKGTLYICEVKFSKNLIHKDIIDEVEKKVKALVIPKYVSYRPVLVHVGGVSDEVIALDYFDKIIDWTHLLSL